MSDAVVIRPHAAAVPIWYTASLTTRLSPASVSIDQRVAPRKRFAPGNGHALGWLETFGSSRLRKTRVCWPGSPAGGPPCAAAGPATTASVARAEACNRNLILVFLLDSTDEKIQSTRRRRAPTTRRADHALARRARSS